jgi:methyl-accepting chemotaxis protein
MKWFYDLRIRTKLLSSFAAILLLTIVVGYQGLTSLQTIIPSFQSMYHDRLVPSLQLVNVVENLYNVRIAVLNHYLSDTPAEKQQYERTIQELIHKNEEIIKAFSATHLVDEQQKTLVKFHEAQEAYNNAREISLKFSREGRKKEALDNIRTNAKVKFEAVLSLAQHLVESQGTVGKELFDQSTQTASTAILTLYAVIAAAIILGMFLAIFIARFFSGPLGDLARQSSLVAEGDLRRVDTPYLDKMMNSKDELGQVTRSFAEMIINLRKTIREVGEATQSVASASAQISSSTEEMAAGAQEQTSQTTEVAGAVEEMTKTIIENSKNASSTAETTKEAKTAAVEGGAIVRETVTGMNRIASVVNASAETVKALGKSSDEIGKIIEVIDDIADQTNLLALNAAIEAARAGEQGRGFAVVADEVRKLAERTTKATKEIAEMIKQIQVETSGAIIAMAEGTKEVERGKELADHAGESLTKIVEISQKVTDMVAQIAAASEQQSSASEQISRNVEAISAVSGETAQGTQQVAHAAEDLNRQSEHLQQLVNQFKLPDEESSNQSRTSMKMLKR